MENKNDNVVSVYDLVIIGGGAAGLMAAGVAASSGKKVILYEKMERGGRKVRITGKGRCNVTNTYPREDFLSKVRSNVDFFTPSFDAFDNQATIDFFRNEGVDLTVERGDRVFPTSGKAWDIANALVDWAIESGAEIEYHTRVADIRTVGRRVHGVTIVTRRGFERNVECRNVMICTGGVSYPATGSTGDGYGFAHKLGHDIEEVRPSLVPLESESEVAQLMIGTRLKNVAVKLLIDGEVAAEEFGEMEFSERGVEGAVVLRLSRQAVDALIEERAVELVIDLKSALDRETLQARIVRELEGMDADAVVGDLIRRLLPKSMHAGFSMLLGVDFEEPVSVIDETLSNSIIDHLKELRIPISNYRPFEEAIITAGGVSVEQIDPMTLQSKLIVGLYFAGEVLDIDADTGGYNLQVAFSTGYLAGQLKG